jgi:putative Mn2+ efflux pump MntP
MTWLEVVMTATGVSVDAFTMSAAVGAVNSRRLTATTFVLLNLSAVTMYWIGHCLGGQFFLGWFTSFRWLAACGLAWVGMRMVLNGRAETKSKRYVPDCFFPIALACFVAGLDVAVASSLFSVEYVPLSQGMFVITGCTLLATTTGVVVGKSLQNRGDGNAQVAGGAILLGTSGLSIWR